MLYWIIQESTLSFEQVSLNAILEINLDPLEMKAYSFDWVIEEEEDLFFDATNVSYAQIFVSSQKPPDPFTSLPR